MFGEKSFGYELQKGLFLRKTSAVFQFDSLVLVGFLLLWKEKF